MSEREDLREHPPAGDESPAEPALDLGDLDAGGSSSAVDLSDLETDAATGSTGADSGSRFSLGLTDRIRSRLGSLFATRAFGVGAISAAVGVFAVGGLLPLGGVGDLLGIASGTFGYGLLASESHYLEVGAAGALVGGVWAFLGHMLLTLLGVGAPVVAVGLVGGAIAGVLGHYFGRDLRHGLTREM